MTNFEKFKNDILKITDTGDGIGIQSGEPVYCWETLCTDCDFHEYNCNKKLFEWLYEEYKEPEPDWFDVIIDKPIIVCHSPDEESYKRHFAGYEGNKVLAFNNGETSWTSKGKTTAWEYARLPNEEEKINDEL